MEPPASPGFREGLREGREAPDYRRLTEAIPYARFLGITVESIADEVVCRMRYQAALAGLGVLHGGSLGALLESAALCKLLQRSDIERRPQLVTLTVQYPRAGRLEDTFAWAHVTRQGRRVANLQMEAWQNERSRIIATGQALFLL